MAYKAAGGGQGVGMRVSPSSMKATLLAFRNLQVSEQNAALMAVVAAGSVLKVEVLKNLNRKDFTLSQLASIDHPFAKRHTKIQSGRLGGSWTKRPYMAHRRDGDLQKSIYGKIVPAKGVAYEVGADINQAPHIKYVIQGTLIMHQRDVIYGTAMQKDVNKKMRVAIVRTFGARLRSQAAIRFG